MKSRDLLKQTEVFQNVKNQILQSNNSVIVINVSREYGKNYIVNQIKKNTVLDLYLEQEIHSFYVFYKWLAREFKKHNIEISDLWPLKEKSKMTNLIGMYLVSELADRILRAVGADALLLVEGFHLVKSAKARQYSRKLLEKLAEKIKIILIVDPSLGALIESRLTMPNMLHIKVEDLRLSKRDVAFLVSRCMENREIQEITEITEYLWEYLGGWPYGTCYALDLLSEGGTNTTMQYICCLNNHPIYSNFVRTVLNERLSQDAAVFLGQVGSLQKVTVRDCNRVFQIPWASHYLNYLASEGLLMRMEKDDSYKLPGLVKQYLEVHGEVKIGVDEGQEEEKARVNTFGYFQVSYHGMQPVWRTKKTKELFAFLFSRQGGAVTKDIILENLWPEYDEEKASQLFYTTMSYMKKNLEVIGLAHLIIGTRKQYRLDMSIIESDYQDLLYIKNAVEQEQWQRITTLPSITDLYQGEYLEFCSSDWCHSIRTHMERMCLQCCRVLGTFELRCGNHLKAINYLEFFRKINPYSEHVISVLLTCYGRCKDYNSVKRVYRETTDVFIKELGIEPGETIKNAYQEFFPVGDDK